MKSYGRVLVVEDNPELRSLIGDGLLDAGYETRTAEHGKVALDVLTKFSPDILIVDIEMPVMDGRELLKTLRARGITPFRVIAMSGKVSERSSPARWFLQKPFDLETLLRVLSEFSAIRTQPLPAPRAA